MVNTAPDIFIFWELRLLFTISWRGPHTEIAGFCFWGLKLGTSGNIFKKMSVLSLCFSCEKNSSNLKLFGDPICPFSTCWVNFLVSSFSNLLYILNSNKDPSILCHPVMADLATVPPPPSTQNEVEGGVHSTLSVVFTFVSTVFSFNRAVFTFLKIVLTFITTDFSSASTVLCFRSSALCFPLSVLCISSSSLKSWNFKTIYWG